MCDWLASVAVPWWLPDRHVVIIGSVPPWISRWEGCWVLARPFDVALRNQAYVKWGLICCILDSKRVLVAAPIGAGIR